MKTRGDKILDSVDDSLVLCMDVPESWLVGLLVPLFVAILPGEGRTKLGTVV